MRIVKCFSSTVDEKKTLGLTALVTVLDILSDIMGMFHLLLRTNNSQHIRAASLLRISC